MCSKFTCILCQNLEIVKRKFRVEKVTFCGFVRHRELILIFLWFVEGIKKFGLCKSILQGTCSTKLK